MKFNNETLRAAVKEWLDDAAAAEATYGHISGWDTSGVTDMSKLFLDAHTFNEPLNNWDVSNVINMHAMFDNAWYSIGVDPLGYETKLSIEKSFAKHLLNKKIGDVINFGNGFTVLEIKKYMSI